MPCLTQPLCQTFRRSHGTSRRPSQRQTRESRESRESRAASTIEACISSGIDG